MHFTGRQKWLNLANVLAWPSFFVLLLLYLPATGFSAVPGSTLLGGMFVELTVWGVFWVAFGLCATSWSLMFATGLLVDGAESRIDPGSGAKSAHAFDILPRWAVRQIGVPVTVPYFLAATALAGWGAAIAVVKSSAAWPQALGGAFAGVVVCYLLLLLLTLPTRWAYADVGGGFLPVPETPLARFSWRLADRQPLRRLFASLRDRLSTLVRFLGLRNMLERDAPDDAPRRIAAPHFFAFTNLLGLLGLLAFFGWYFFPPREPGFEAPAAAFLLVLVTLLIWTLLGIEHQLARLRVSPLLVLLAITVTVSWIDAADHYYYVRPVPAPAGEAALSPVEVAASSRAPENLVVVTSAGGGILAAGWTTLALQNLIADRPRLADEIRLLSTVSGGSVGAAFYLDALRAQPRLAAQSSDEVYRLLGDVQRRSVESSLREAAYGFAFLDFWRLFVGGWPQVLQHWDRGLLLENAWQRAAGSKPVTVNALRPLIRSGQVPGFVLNATAMEIGRRIMQTPIVFDPPAPDEVVSDERADTLSELLFGVGGRTEGDLSLFTAARMSATFPYVSPAARAELRDAWEEEGVRPAGTAALHLIDGGYFDNFGVASALDWLTPVLQQRLACLYADQTYEVDPTEQDTGSVDASMIEAAKGDPVCDRLRFERVLVVQLNPFAFSNPANAKPAPGSVAALFGPVVGLVAIQNGTALSRNAIELTRFLTSWNRRFDVFRASSRYKDGRPGADLCLGSVTFRPPKGEVEPLSWHLTTVQKEVQRNHWQRHRADPGSSIETSWNALHGFLTHETSCAEARPMAHASFGVARTAAKVR